MYAGSCGVMMMVINNTDSVSVKNPPKGATLLASSPQDHGTYVVLGHVGDSRAVLSDAGVRAYDHTCCTCLYLCGYLHIHTSSALILLLLVVDCSRIDGGS